MAGVKLLAAHNRQITARSTPLARALHQAMLAQANILIDRYRRGTFGKASKTPEKTIVALLERYGLTTAQEAFGRARKLVTRETAARTPKISDWEGYLIGVTARADEVMYATEQAILDEIKRVIEEAQSQSITPTQTTIARELRARLTGKTSFDNFVPGGDFTGFNGAFTFERASRIARTELAISENTGAVEGYKDAGIESIEWLGYRTPIWPRRHDKMIGETVAIGKKFTLPDGTRMLYPGDPSAPVRHLAHCRCSTGPVLKLRRS